jgi:hypothetical protein
MKFFFVVLGMSFVLSAVCVAQDSEKDLDGIVYNCRKVQDADKVYSQTNPYDSTIVHGVDLRQTTKEKETGENSHLAICIQPERDKMMWFGEKADPIHISTKAITTKKSGKGNPLCADDPFKSTPKDTTYFLLSDFLQVDYAGCAYEVTYTPIKADSRGKPQAPIDPHIIVRGGARRLELIEKLEQELQKERNHLKELEQEFGEPTVKP